jgi:hypothetical protein
MESRGGNGSRVTGRTFMMPAEPPPASG